MLRRGLPWFWRHFGVGNLYRLFSLYGQSYRLPLIWILVLLVLTPWVLMIGGIDLTPAVSGDFENTVFFTLEGLASDWEATVADYLDALMASFSFATFNRQEMSVVLQHPWQRALASLETALLIVFVTFFLLAIRRRFTRKSF